MSTIKYKVGEQEYSADELVALGAKNADLFYQLFFPKTVRQESAPFHLDLDAALDDPTKRYVLAKMFRGSAKTTRLRMYTARRVAYGLSKTILYVGASEAHAARSVKWVRRQVEINKVFSGVFGLSLESKKSETEIDIKSAVTGEICWVLGAGITGNIRGINFDDYRPDLIVLDDIVTDENAATLEQREKVIDLVEGALRGSLTPATEDPNAKMVLAQTPLNQEDVVAELERDTQWFKIEAPIWTKETIDLPVEQQLSVWEVRYPTSVVRADKAAAFAKNRGSIWIRENEVRLVSPERRAFKSGWLQPVDIMPEHTYNIMAIDPVPPPSDREIAKGMAGKDYECLMVVGHNGGRYFCREYAANRGHEPNWTVNEFFRLADRWGVLKVCISAVAYEKTLKWIFEQEMRRRGKYYMIELVTDRRPKYNRIVSTLAGLGSNGKLFCSSNDTELLSQFSEYDQVKHDDVLECFALGISRLANPVLEIGSENYQQIQLAGSSYRVPRLRSAP